MPKPRFSGGSVSMRVSSSQMVPPESCMRPAMQLSAVDLPQPDGPSSAMNSPRRDRQRQLVERVERLAARAGEAARDVIEPQFGEIVFISSMNVARPSAADGCATITRRMRDASTSSSARRPAGPRCGTPRPAPWLERLRVRELLQPAFVLRTPVFLDRVLALLRRHRQRHVLHRRTRDRSSPCRRCSACASGVSMKAIRSSITAIFSGGTPFGITM